MEFIANCLVGIAVIVVLIVSLFFVAGLLHMIAWLHDRRIK